VPKPQGFFDLPCFTRVTFATRPNLRMIVSTTGGRPVEPQPDLLVATGTPTGDDSMWSWCGSSTASRGSVSHLLRALETFRALGIEFVSLSEQVDTSTPTGKMVFTVLGAVAELGPEKGSF